MARMAEAFAVSRLPRPHGFATPMLASGLAGVSLPAGLGVPGLRTAAEFARSIAGCSLAALSALLVGYLAGGRAAARRTQRRQTVMYGGNTFRVFRGAPKNADKTKKWRSVIRKRLKDQYMQDHSVYEQEGILDRPHHTAQMPADVQTEAAIKRQKALKDGMYAALKGWRRGSRRMAAPAAKYTNRAPVNPWQDRYLICKCCDTRQRVKDTLPKLGCNGSTVFEVDITRPFDRENVMVASCEMVQCMKEGHWVTQAGDGTHMRVPAGTEGGYPVQVCANCRVTTLQMGRAFTVCPTCEGAAYCSERCMAEHRPIHSQTCVKPMLPFRTEWGVEKGLHDMQKEIYPLMKVGEFKEPHAHRISWLKRPEHVRNELAEKKVVFLPGFGKQKKTLPMRGTTASDFVVERRGRNPGALVHRAPSDSDLVSYEPVRKTSTSEPAPEWLLMSGMTLEEWKAKDADVQLESVKEDAKAFRLWDKKQKEMEMVPIERETRVEPKAEWIGSKGIRVRGAPDVLLDGRAAARIDAAVAAAPSQPRPERRMSPWDQLVKTGKDSTGQYEIREPNPGTGDAPPLEERLPGVVYRESLVREKLKRKGLRLSEEAIQRMELVGTPQRKKDPTKKWHKPELEWSHEHLYNEELTPGMRPLEVARRADKRAMERKRNQEK